MRTRPSTTETNGVILIRLGIAGKTYPLADGTTLAELLQRAQIHTEGSTVTIDGRPQEEFIILRPGMTVTIIPEDKNALDDRWLESIGMFADDPLFRELVESVEARREAEREAAWEEPS